MATWSEVEQASASLAAEAKTFLDASIHKTIATLKLDGSPRISGIELEFGEGEMWLGSMWQAVKARDLQRDPRFALHSASLDPPDWTGDAKIAGRAVEITDPERIATINGPKAPPGPSHLFRLDISEVVVVKLGDPADHLIIESWHEGRGTTSRRR